MNQNKSSETNTKHSSKNKPTYEHETNKKGQRQGGIDKRGEKEKDRKGEF